MFNKVVIDYESKVPMKFLLTYEMENGETMDDYFFLEKNQNHFEGFILGYTEGKKATKILMYQTKILGNEEDENATILKVDTKLLDVIANDTCYIDSDRYKLGIRLIWGGGVNFLFDKKCTIPGFTNFVNQYDTGRLIQQSYYGCGENEENPWGEFMGNRWPYNPVQGGDKGLTHSRLIDATVSENEIYIKAQPRDWGKTDFSTPSYMENWYTLDGDLIKVRNRFVDYSGWKHPITNQETPAFYTQSYFDRFVFYDGNNPWQDDELNIRDNLHFWAFPTYQGECDFFLKESNTEVWSAWVSSKDNYGIGLYVPEVDILKAGRYEYNGSIDPDNLATNYTAPLAYRGIIAYEPMEYSYLLTCGNVDEIRKIFKENKDFADNHDLRINNNRHRRPDTAEDFPKYI